MSKVTKTREIVEGVLSQWNKNLNELKHKFCIEIKINIRQKKYYINKKDFYESHIAELLLLHKKLDPSEKNLLLYRIEIPYNKSQTNDELIEFLYGNLMYEMLGAFTVITKQTITTQDFAEYDIDNDRLMQHESAKGMVIKTLIGGPFFEAGDEFDVFMDTEGEYYAVYTQHEYGKKNNGIARIPKKDCLVIQVAKKSIKLLTDL